MGFKYRYKKKSKRELTRSKKIIIIIISVILLLAFYALRDSFSGFATYTRSADDKYLNQSVEKMSLLPGEKEECESKLQTTEIRLGECNTNLTNLTQIVSLCQSAQASYRSAESRATQSENYASQIGTSLVNCEEDQNNLSDQILRLEENIHKIAINGVKFICCTPGIDVAQWDLINNTIICRGNYTINCTGIYNFTLSNVSE